MTENSGRPDRAQHAASPDLDKVLASAVVESEPATQDVVESVEMTSVRVTGWQQGGFIYEDTHGVVHHITHEGTLVEESVVDDLIAFAASHGVVISRDRPVVAEADPGDTNQEEV